MSVPFRRLSRRRRTRALVVALIDRLELGPPEVVTGAPLSATADGWCSACGTYYLSGTQITLSHVNAGESWSYTWIHDECPPWWEIVKDLTEARDDLIVTKVAPEGRRVASCGHSVNGEPAYLVRRPVSRRKGNHSYWICEECVTR